MRENSPQELALRNMSSPLRFAYQASRDASVRLVARVLGTVFQASTLVLIARELGADAFGAFSIVLAAGYLAGAVFGFGASTRVLRVAAEADPRSVANSLLWLRIFGSIATFAVCTALSQLHFDMGICIAAGTIAGSDVLLEFVQARYAGEGKQLLSSLVVVLQRGLPLIGIASMGALDTMPLVLLPIVFVLVAAALSLSTILKSFGNLDIVETMRSSFGYWLSGVSSNFRQLEPLVLGAIASSSVVGSYAIATRMTNPLTILVGALQTVLVPGMAKSRNKKEFDRLYRLLLSIAIVYGLLIAIFSQVISELALWALGEEYKDAQTLIVAMIVASGFSCVAQAFQAKLIVMGRPAMSGWIISGGTALGLVLMMSIIATLGETSIWVAPLTTQLIILVFMAIAATRSSNTHEFV